MNEAGKNGAPSFWHAGPVTETLAAKMYDEIDSGTEEAIFQLPEKGEELIAQEIRHDGLKRRAFLQRMAAAGLGCAAVSLLGGCNGGSSGGSGPNPNPNPGDGVFDPRNFPGIIGRNINETVMNFTLSHEHLEVDLYRQALNIAAGLAVNTPLDPARNYTLSIAPGNLNADSGQAAQDGMTFLRNQAFVETAHRDFLIASVRSMGGTPQPPNPDGYQFPNGPGNTLRDLLANILVLEQNGQRGLLGGAPFLTTLNLIQTAATLHSVECRHIAALKHTIGRPPGPEREADDLLVTPNYPSPDTFEYYRTPPTVIARDRPYMR